MANWVIDANIIVMIFLALVTLANTIIVGILKIGVTKFSNEMAGLWTAVNIIRTKQEELRSELPKEYLMVRSPGYKALTDGIKRIEDHFEEFAGDCKDGKCLLGRKTNKDAR